MHLENFPPEIDIFRGDGEPVIVGGWPLGLEHKSGGGAVGGGMLEGEILPGVLGQVGQNRSDYPRNLQKMSSKNSLAAPPGEPLRAADPLSTSEII